MNVLVYGGTYILLLDFQVAFVVNFCMPFQSTKVGGRVRAAPRMTAMDESGKPCEWKFGSYCIWREENREVIKDSMVKKLKDQLFVARAYYPSIAKLPTQSKLTQELKQNIQELERVLSESTTDRDLPLQ